MTLLPSRLLKSGLRRWNAWTERRLMMRRLSQSPEPLPPAPDGYVVFFTPEAGVRPHYSAQLVIARCLQQRGHSVAFVRCYRCLTRCPVMDFHGLPAVIPDRQMNSFCLKCCTEAHRALDEQRIPFVDLRTLQDDASRSHGVNTLVQPHQELLDVEFDGKPFGKLCALDLALAYKVADFRRVSHDQRKLWSAYISASIESYQATKELIRRHAVRRIVCFNDYSVFLGVRMAGEASGIPVMSMTQATHCNIDRRKYVFYKKPSTMTYVQQSEAWPAWRTLALNPERIRDIGNDIFERFRGVGSHVYSPAKTFGRLSVRDTVGVGRDKKLLVAYTSSLDELRAAGMLREALKFQPLSTNTPFVSQIEWLRALIEDTESRNDRNLIVRIHPREGANKRDNASSQHLELLKAAFDRPFRNCRIVWPQDQMSSYDLAEAADIALTSWSSIGLELARMGVPVVVCAHGHMETPDDDFLNWGRTPQAYFNKIEEVLARSPSLGPVIRAFRWYNLIHLGAALDLGDVIPDATYEGVPEFKVARESGAIEQILIYNQDVLDINHKKLEAEQTTRSQEVEAAAIRLFLRRLIVLLMTGKPATEDRPMRCLTDSGDVQGQSIFIESNDGMVRMGHEGAEWMRESPLVSRLIPLVQC